MENKKSIIGVQVSLVTGKDEKECLELKVEDIELNPKEINSVMWFVNRTERGLMLRGRNKDTVLKKLIKHYKQELDKEIKQVKDKEKRFTEFVNTIA